VVPRRISDLERKRDQYQDYGFVRAKRQLNVASKRRYLRNVWKEPCTGCGFVTFVTFLRFSDILGFAKKTKKYLPSDKNLERSQSSKLWHCDILKCHKMSQNVTLFQTFENPRKERKKEDENITNLNSEMETLRTSTRTTIATAGLIWG